MKKIRDTDAPKDEILLGIDFGKSNIGLAFGRSGLVTPVKIISAKDWNFAISEVSKLVIENKITKIVIGLPLSVEGKETPFAKDVKKFGKLLKIHLKKPVEYVDEYGSTQESVKSMLGLGFSRRRRQESDHFSAAVILKNYYDTQD